MVLPFLQLSRHYANDWPCTATVLELRGAIARSFMLAVHWTSVLLVAASSLVRAQLVIENPRHLDVPEQQAQVLFQTTARVLESEFHSPRSLENTFRMRLVLGEKAERFTIDDPSGNGTLYLEKWNEGKFAIAAMRLAVQHLLVPERQKRMLEEIVRRTHEITPVKAAQLRNEQVPSAVTRVQDDCIAKMMNTAVRGVDCRPSAITSRPATAQPER